jgi:hypothetical protein
MTKLLQSSMNPVLPVSMFGIAFPHPKEVSSYRAEQQQDRAVVGPVDLDGR